MTDVFRQEFTPVSEQNKAKVLEIKKKAQELSDLYDLALIDTAEETADSISNSPIVREISLARTKLEESAMWAVKGLTSPELNQVEQCQE